MVSTFLSNRKAEILKPVFKFRFKSNFFTLLYIQFQRKSLASKKIVIFSKNKYHDKFFKINSLCSFITSRL